MWAAVAQEILLLFLPLLPIIAEPQELAGKGALHVSAAVKMEAAFAVCEASWDCGSEQLVCLWRWFMKIG